MALAKLVWKRRHRSGRRIGQYLDGKSVCSKSDL